MMADRDVFRCHGSLKETIWHSELGASAAILEAGYNLDCLLLKYQGIDWRKHDAAWQCNRGYGTVQSRSLYPAFCRAGYLGATALLPALLDAGAWLAAVLSALHLAMLR